MLLVQAMVACAPSPARRRKIRQSAQVRGLAGPMMGDESIPHDREVVMFQRVRMAYQFLAQSIKQTPAPRRPVRLNVVQLEERTTPAIGIDLVAPIDPPDVAHWVSAPPPIAPTPQVLACNAAVRADLFGVGDAGAEHVDALEEMLAAVQVEKKEAAVESAAAQPDTNDANVDADAGAAVIIEDMVYVPRVE